MHPNPLYRTDDRALCERLIEEIGFDVDRRIDKSQLTGSEIRLTTLSKAISRLASRRIYHSIGYFEIPGKKGVVDLEAYKQQCYFVTHVIYAFSDWGQHPLRRQLFIEEFKFMVSNASTVIEVLKVRSSQNELNFCTSCLLCIFVSTGCGTGRRIPSLPASPAGKHSV